MKERRSCRGSVYIRVPALFVLVLSLTAILFFFRPAEATTNQWSAITPAGTSGYAYNTIAAIGNYVYLGTDHGVYKSTDAGTTWNQVNTGLGASLNVTSIAIGWTYSSGYSVTSSSYVFVSTGNGVYASTIGGSSWTATSTNLSDTNVSDVVIDQYQATQGSYTDLYVATPSGVFISTSTGSRWQLDNSGISGTPTRLMTDYGNAKIYALTSGNKIYGSTLHSSSGTTQTWTQAFDAQGTTTHDISLLNAHSYIGWLATDKGIYKSDDNGQNWASTSIGLQGQAVQTVASDYLDQNISYAAVSGGGIYRTTNEAIKNADPQIPEWLPINQNLSDTGITSIATDPSVSTAVYATGSSGVYKLTYSNTPIEFIDLTPPSVVTDLATNVNDSTSFTLTWTAPGNDAAYGTSTAYDIRYSSTSPITDLNWSSDTQVSPQPTPGVSGTAETYTVYNLQANTTYYFALKASDGTNQSALSNVAVSGSVVVPTLTTSAPSSVSTSTMTLNANISSTGGASITQSGFAYGTNSSLSSGVSTTSLGAQGGTGNFSGGITGLTPNTLYYVRAYAVNSAGTSTGAIVSTTTTALSFPTISTSAANPVSTSTATLNANLSSAGNTGVTQHGFAYCISVAGCTNSSLSSGVSTSTLGSATAGTFNQNITGLTANSTYYVRAYAVNTAGTSMGSIVSFATTDTTAPTVSMTSPTAGALVAGSSISLAATASDDVGVVGVQFKLDGTSNIGAEDTTNPYGVTWDSTSITILGSHTLYAVARDAAGNRATSTVSVTVDNVKPTIVSAVYNSGTQITVTLSTTSNPSTITKSNDGGFTVTKTGSPGTTYTVSSIAPGSDNSKVILTVADMTAAGGERVLSSLTVIAATALWPIHLGT